MKVKDVGASAQKFAQRASAAASDYISGVKNPRTSWQGATLAGEANYESGVQEAIGRKAFGSGVQKVSDATWSNKAATKGGRNYPTAVREAAPDWQAGFAPYASVLNSTTLPPRGPRGSAMNYDRSRAVGEALNKARVGA